MSKSKPTVIEVKAPTPPQATPATEPSTPPVTQPTTPATETKTENKPEAAQAPKSQTVSKRLALRKERQGQ